MHDVDEDDVTLAAFGDRFIAEDFISTTVGMYHRYLNTWSNKDYIGIDVASMCRHSRIMFIAIRISMMSTKTR